MYSRASSMTFFEAQRADNSLAQANGLGLRDFIHKA
jgi:hypothetical protein